ncbi:MAG: rRNA maturation RNase YbeY [Nitrospira sp.]|nr:rRNA maturation RNase YbeY [Nitrospira sp.]
MAVYVRERLTRVRVRQAALRRLAERVLVAVGEKQSELSIDLVADGRMRRLNREYRKKDRTTDVLAFAMRDADVGKGQGARGERQGARGKGPRAKRKRLLPFAPSPAPELLGDVVISIPTATRQARQGGRSLDEELAVLLIHGILHLCGYDHERNELEARRMRRREQAIMRSLTPLPRLLMDPRHGSLITHHG